MSQPIRITESTVRPLRIVESTVRRLDPAEVAAALGGVPTGDRLPSASPVALYATRAELYRRRKSGDRGVKASLNGPDRDRLEQFAATLNGDGTTPSLERVAGALISMSLDAIADGSRDRAALLARLAAAESDVPAV